jgi:hypothetical protein
MTYQTITGFFFDVEINSRLYIFCLSLGLKDAPQKNLCKRSYFSLVVLAKKLKLPFCLNNFFAGLLQTYPLAEKTIKVSYFRMRKKIKIEKVGMS